jgi:regulator of protease activity HflC (stomatin/prohibitin superfamily)
MSTGKFVLGAVITGVVFIGGLVYTIGGITHVSVGSIGIEKHMSGKVTEVPQGTHWTGWGVSIEKYPTYTQSLILKNWVVGTGDQQELPVDTNLTWKISNKNVTALYQSIGGQDIDYVKTNIVEPTMKNVVNQITHTDSWNNIKGSEQKAITEQIQKQLTEELGKFGIEVGTFGFTAMGSPAGMANTQQQLAASELNIKKAQQDQDRAKIENQTKVLTAQAQAQQTVIDAEAKAKANQILAKSVTPELVQYQEVQKWTGVGPTTVVGSGASSMVQLPSAK